MKPIASTYANILHNSIVAVFKGKAMKFYVIRLLAWYLIVVNIGFKFSNDFIGSLAGNK